MKRWLKSLIEISKKVSLSSLMVKLKIENTSIKEV